MADENIEAIRQARLQQLREQGGPGQNSAEDQQKQREAEAKSSILSQILTPEAADRLNRIRLVKESRATDVENRLIMLARSGQLRQIVSEEVLISILNTMSEQEAKEAPQAQKIVTQRRGWDDDLDLDDLDF